MTDRGVLYVVAGDGERYAKAAVASAESLRCVMPDIPLAVATDRPIDGPFDYRIPISETDVHRAKMVGALQTPFDLTVMLDVDTYILAELGELFELLGGFDMALAHAPNRVLVPLDDVPESFPEFNTGVIAYRRTDLVQFVLDEWLREYDQLAIPKDQPAFRRVAYRTPGLRIATLTPEFNQRFEMAGFLNQPVRILHGWADEAGYRKVAEAMKTPPGSVFTGRRVYDRHAKKVGDFTLPWRRLRGVVRRNRNCMARLRGTVKRQA